jgi:IS5 family transposase
LAFYYKAHVGVDGGRPRIITAVDITPGEVADEYLLERLLKEHVGVTRRQVEEVVADTKYGTHANYVRLREAGIRATIPPHSAMRERGEYRADHFVYELATDRYRCPSGQYLRRQGSSHTAGAAGGIIYRGQPKICGACPVKPACCPTGAARTLLRPDDADLRELTLAHLRTSRAWRHRRQRSCWSETANAELKERHGLHRAQYRGRDKVLIQAFGAAGAYNLKKLARLVGRQPASAALALAGAPRCLAERPGHGWTHLRRTGRPPCLRHQRPARSRGAFRRPSGLTPRVRQQARWKHLDVPHSTVRTWWHRFRARSPTTLAHCSALAVALDGTAVMLATDGERAALDALQVAWQRARIRFGDAVGELWRFWSRISGGEALGTNTISPWAGGSGADWMTASHFGGHLLERRIG